MRLVKVCAILANVWLVLSVISSVVVCRFVIMVCLIVCMMGWSHSCRRWYWVSGLSHILHGIAWLDSEPLAWFCPVHVQSYMCFVAFAFEESVDEILFQVAPAIWKVEFVHLGGRFLFALYVSLFCMYVECI